MLGDWPFLLEIKMKEVWKDIEGYEGYYQVSNFGKIKSLKRERRLLEIILKEKKDKDGYLRVNLFKKNKRKMYGVHCLVLQAFISNPENKPQVNHKDGVKINNNFENLEWNTNSENQKHAWKTGLHTARYGENHGQSKLNDWDVKVIRKLYKNSIYWHNQTRIATLFKISQACIYKIVNNETWKHI